jgi:tetratricopeptide (TPR) repeat protein
MDDVVGRALALTYKSGSALEKANAAWARIRASMADDRRAVTELCKLLQRGGRAAQAGEFIAGVAAAMPAALWPQALAATHDLESGAQLPALAAAQALMQRFPNQPDGYQIAIAALTRLDRLSDAETLLADCARRFGETDWQLLAAIGIGQKRRDWPTVLKTAEALRALAPKKSDGLVQLALALSHVARGEEAEQLVQQALARFPRKAAVLKAAATVAETRAQFEQALERWAGYRAHFPASKAGYIYPLQILQKTRRLDLAGNILEEAEEKFPRDSRILQLLAAIAAREGRWQEADRHWQKLVSMDPKNADYALSAALVPLGHRMGRRKRLPELLRRLDALHLDFPDFVEGYVAHLGVLRDQRMLAEAEAQADSWCAKFPDSEALALARVGIAEDSGRYDDALAHLNRWRALGHASLAIETAFVRILSRASRDAEAEAACAALLQAYPRDRAVNSEYARLASRRGDWPEALNRWRAAQARLPNDRQIAREISLVATELAGQADADAFAGTPAAENLFARFESLGGTATGCEFGMAQRKFGSEGVGLLRWTKSSIANLTAALETDFQGVGDEEHTVLSTAWFSATREEYVTSDKRFEMESHTFMNTSAAPADKMFAQTCRRLRFLRNKLIEDLKAAEKIFVFKVQDPESDENLRRLYAAMRRYGDVTLLCVLEADADNARGTIRVLEPGLLVGYIGYFLRAGDTNARGIDFVTWKILAEKAEQLRIPPTPAAAVAA